MNDAAVQSIEPISNTGMRSIVFASATAALAGLLFGYDTGVAAGIQGYLQTFFHLTNAQLGFAIASLEMACVPGALFAGTLADHYGRKTLLLFCAAFFAVSGILSAIAWSFTALVLARILGGLAIGASSMVAPVYIAEIAPEKHRGRLGSLFQLAIVVGIAAVYWVNFLILNVGGYLNTARSAGADWNQTMGWRWMLGSELFPAAIFFVMILSVPESPRWLIINDRESEGKNILTRFLGSAGAEREIQAVKEVAAWEEGRLSELFTPRYRLPLMMALVLAVFSQFSGIASVIYYTPRIFEAAGMKATSAFGSTALVGMVNLAFTFIAVGLVDKAGRKLLLAIGTGIQVVALACVGVVFLLAARVTEAAAAPGRMGQNTGSQFTHTQVILLLVSLLIYIAAFAMAMGPIPWIIISEIFPARIRGRAASVGVLTLWLANAATTQTFPILKAHAGLTTTFFIYSGCSLVSFLFVLLILPETKGKTLEQIEAQWRHRYENKTI